MEWAFTIALVVVAVLVTALLLRGRGSSATDVFAQIDQQQRDLTALVKAMSETNSAERGELTRSLNERLEQVSKSVQENLRVSNERTGKSLGDLNERLVVIDRAQKDITSLSGQVVGLQQILDNKQARGSFGETRLNDLVQDALPRDAFRLQHSLSNGRRADCLILLPDPPGPVVVDSKFPLESYRAMIDAETTEQRKNATTQLGRDVLKHADDIASRYIIPGETAEAALMFLPSESVFSELHLNLPDVVQKCRDLRVYPVSPNTMWLTLNTVRAIMRDVEMHEKASLIQKEVRVLMKDVERLATRVDKLRGHFTQAEQDISDIETSTRKITSRSDRIGNADIDTGKAQLGLAPDDEA